MRNWSEEVPAKGLRFVLDSPLGLIKIARLDWSNADSSLYITPYMPTGGSGYVGVQMMEPRTSQTFDFTTQGTGQNPRLSLHESGQVHAKCEPDYRTEPVRGRPLFDEAGGHIATIGCFDETALPLLSGRPRGAPNIDLVLRRARPEVKRTFIAIYASASAVGFVAPVQFRVKMVRPTMPQPLHIGIHVRGEDEQATDTDARGVVTFGGWGPGSSDHDPAPLVFAITR